MDDPDEYDEVEEDDEQEEHPEPEVTIEVSGLSLFTHVGVTAAEREVGQRLLLDLRLDVGNCDATVTDRIEDTVDYAQVCELANLVAQQRSYKTLEHNLELLRRLDELVALGRPVVIGTSRKSFLGRLTGREVDDRLAATIATNVLAYERGARVFRVHDVAPVRDALTVAAATVTAPWTNRTSTTR